MTARSRNTAKEDSRGGAGKGKATGEAGKQSKSRRGLPMAPGTTGQSDAGAPEAAAQRIPHELNDHPGHLLRRAQQIVVASFYDNVGRDSLTPLQYALLVALDENPGIDQVTLAKLVALDNSTTAETAVRLEAKGLIVRELYIEKRRQRRLSLTRTGKEVLQGMQSGIQNMKNQLLARLAPDEQEPFLRLLRGFVNAEGAAPDDDVVHVTGRRALPQAALGASRKGNK